MKSIAPKWLMIPPAVALLVILGPLSMSGGTDTATKPAAAQAAAATPEGPQTEPNRPGSRPVPGSLVPRTPDMWKMSSALVGVLLLGAGGILLLKKLRGGATPSGNSALATLRQTIRLTPKQALHAIEFDNRILLIGESEKGLNLIDRGRVPESASDEETVLARQFLEQQDDQGATPKNLLIPRPDNPPAQQTPSRPALAAAKPVSKQDQAIAKLNDFRTLLAKAGR